MLKHHLLALGCCALSILASQAQDNGTWIQQNPRLPLMQMSDLAMDASGTGLAVSATGTIFRTSNFGQQWSALSNSFPSLSKVAFVPGSNGQQAWVASSGNTALLRTNDSGQTWQPIASSGNLNNLSLLAAPSAQAVYAGSSSRIFKTINQGQSWQEVTPATGQIWRSLSFVNSSTGWASTNSGAIFRTTDGGQSWTEPSPGQFDTQVHVLFQTPDRGYAAAFRSFYQTDNGGADWQLLAAEAFSTHISALHATDSGFMLAVLGNTSFATTDGGTNWSRIQPLSYTYSNRGAATFPDGRAWIAGSHTMIAHTTDFGQTYVDQLSGFKGTLAFIGFSSLQHGWAAGQNGLVLRTLNGGSDWADVSLASGSSIEAGLAFSSDECWVAASDQLLRTTDGGQSWNAFGSGLSASGTITAMQEIGGKVFLSAYSGKVYRTANQGANWAELPTGNTARLFAIHFPDAQTGYAVGEQGTALKTTDGGDSWTSLSVPTANSLNAVFFMDADRGWITYSNNSNEILHTTDGGATWSATSLPASGFWRGFATDGAEAIYLVGGQINNGTVLRSIDGGVNWEAFYNTYSILSAAAYQEDGTARRLWISGIGGNISRWEATMVRTQEPIAPAPLQVFPNPTHGRLHITLPTGAGPEASILLYDYMGRQRLAQPYRPEISLTGLESGWYLLRLLGSGKVYQASVLVQRE